MKELKIEIIGTYTGWIYIINMSIFPNLGLNLNTVQVIISELVIRYWHTESNVM